MAMSSCCFTDYSSVLSISPFFPPCTVQENHYIAVSSNLKNILQMLIRISLYLISFVILNPSTFPSWSRAISMTMMMREWASEDEELCDSSTSTLWNCVARTESMWFMEAQAHYWPLTSTACRKMTSGRWHALWRRCTQMALCMPRETLALSQPNPLRCTATRVETRSQRARWKSQSSD